MTDEERIEKLAQLLAQIEPLMQGFPSVVSRLSSLQENYDEQHRSAYHALEVIDMSASQGSKFIKQVKEMSRERRKNKLLLELATDIQDILKNKQVNVPQGIKSQITQATSRNYNKGESIKNKALVNGKAFIDKVVKADTLKKRLLNK